MNGEVLLQHLNAAVGADATAIVQATKALQSAGGCPGVSTALAQIGLQPHLDFGIRQLALLVCCTRRALDPFALWQRMLCGLEISGRHHATAGAQTARPEALDPRGARLCIADH